MEPIIPPEWGRLAEEDLSGLLMVLGASDSGKSTLANWLFHVLQARGEKLVAYLDGDPGQGTLGPPTTLSLLMAGNGKGHSSPADHCWRWFLGATTPRGHMLPHLVGIARLVERARTCAVSTVIYDTTGLIDPSQGGLALKQAKIDLLRPTHVIAIRRGGELESLLGPLRTDGRTKILEFPPSPFVRNRDTENRRRSRMCKWARYFSEAVPMELDLTRLPLIPPSRLYPGQVLALQNRDGFTRALGILRETASITSILTPLRELSDVVAIRVGALGVDPLTGAEFRLI